MHQMQQGREQTAPALEDLSESYGCTDNGLSEGRLEQQAWGRWVGSGRSTPKHGGLSSLLSVVERRTDS